MLVINSVFSSVFGPTIPDVNWIPNSLFALAEPGVWYDPSDLTTLFQDNLGATPVTAPAQTVGMMLDKSGRGNHATQATLAQRPTYGINPIVGTRNLLIQSGWSNAVAGTPGTAPTGWSFFFGTGSTSLSGGLDAEGDQAIKFDATVGQRISYNQAVNVVAGNTYSLSADVVAVSGAGGIVISIGSGTATGTSTNVVSPSLGRATARYVCTTSGTVGLRLGLGITVGVTATASITLKKPQFEIGTVATAYQKVVTQYEVTQTGIQSIGYLAFDGVDDGMVTGTITPGTDKVQVFAGLRKLSNVAGIIYETSVAAFSNAGAISAFSGFNGAVAGAYWSVYSRGNGALVTTTTGATFAAPSTAVVTQIADIAAPRNTLRVNAAQQSAVTTTQGTGNYLAYPLYIGRRAGASLTFNGYIYSLITRFGPNLTTQQITSAETYVNGKTGAY